MPLVNFLAQIWGISLVIISFSFLIRPKNIKKIFAVMSDESQVVFLGMLTTVLGVALVLVNGSLDYSWVAILTILGWLVFIKGIIFLFFPEHIENFVKKIKQNEEKLPFLFVITIALGCFLIFMGFSF